jgi:F-type H+-transporting ATPase subunit delta
MISRTMGRRYSKALLALALERNEVLVELCRELREFSEALATGPGLMHFLTDPNVLMTERSAALDKILANIETRPLVDNLARLLVRKNRIEFLPDIAREFQELVDIQEGVVRASVTSAIELSTEDRDRLRALLGSHFGKKVELTVAVDSELIGGLVIKVGSLSFDGSIRSQLRDIQSQLLDEVPIP